MIFTLDLYASTILLASLWLLMIFSFMSGRMVKMGDPEDPHNNLMRPENDVNVCNYDLDFARTKYNSSTEIECYVKSSINKQTKTLWKLCQHTLYHVLYEARNTSTLNVMVQVANIDGVARTTTWGEQQTNNLKKIIKKSINEWRKVLHNAHPHDFMKEDHEIQIVAVVQPSSDGRMQRYNGIAWDVEKDESRGLIDIETSGLGDFNYYINDLRKLNIHMTVIFENSSSSGTYGYVVRRNYLSSDRSFVMGQCFTKGVTVYINDTVGADLPYAPWKTYFVLTFMTTFIVLVALQLMLLRKTSYTLLVIALIISLAVAYYICNTVIQIPMPPVLDGHPLRFSSDVFPVSLLTHELGHSLLMADHYKVQMGAVGTVISTGLPGPLKPFDCVMTPISIMGAENHITPLDEAYVSAMWAMLQGRDYVHRSMYGKELWRLSATANAPLITHNDKAKTFISNFRTTHDISEDTKSRCADQSTLPMNIMNIRPESLKKFPTG